MDFTAFLATIAASSFGSSLAAAYIVTRLLNR